MTGHPRSRWPDRKEQGSVTVFFAVAVVAVLVLIGLIVDGGGKIRAIQRADALAAEAARAGGQAIALPPAIAGKPPTLEPAAAAAAARAYLAGNGATGSVTVAPGGRRLDVEVTGSSPTVFLGLIGIATITVRGKASAVLVRGIQGPLR
jgi:hypothetical protein